MVDYNRYGHGHGHNQGYAYAPSAPPAPMPTTSAPTHSSSSPSPYGYGYDQGGYPSAYPPPMGGFGGGAAVAFPPGTPPEVERAFRAVDRDGSGSVDERELQGALSDAYHRFSVRTVRLLMFLFSNRASSPPSPSRMGPAEFVSLWNCLGQWRGLTEKFKEKDTRYTGSATLTYDGFLSMVIPFIVP